MDKDATRRLAREFGLPVSEKADSQDICFVPQGRYADVIAKLRPEANRPGEIVDLGGRRLGAHDGIIHYTVGQRRGLRLAVGEALYVVRLEPETARVVVGPRPALATERMRLSDVNWLGSRPLAEVTALSVAVRVRSTRQPRPAVLNWNAAAGCAEITLTEPEDGVSPGQACVVYADASAHAQVLGGGTIRRADTVPALHPRASEAA